MPELVFSFPYTGFVVQLPVATCATSCLHTFGPSHTAQQDQPSWTLVDQEQLAAGNRSALVFALVACKAGVSVDLLSVEGLQPIDSLADQPGL
jgi:hypothetical protein